MYTPSPIPQDTNQLSNFLSLELNNIASSMTNTYRLVLTNSNSNSATDAALICSGGAGALIFDDGGQKRITWNDGGGNFNIRAGNYFNGSLLYAKGIGDSDGGAATITMSSDSVAGSIGLYVAPVGTHGTAVTYSSNSILLDTTSLRLNGTISINGIPTINNSVSGVVGAKLILKKPATTSLQGDINIDAYSNYIRAYDNVSGKGWYVDLTSCAAVVGTNLLTPAWANITGKPASPSSGDWFSNGYPIINSGGVMEIGRYIDFHSTDTSTADYTYRLDNSSTGVLTTSGALTVGGTLNCSGVIYPNESSGQMFVNTSGSKGLEVRSAGGATDAAYMSFHRQGYYAVHFGLGTNNKLSVGGWSMGSAQYEIFHSGNVNTYFPKSASTNGYQELPTGIIIQWGQATSSGTTANNCAVTLPTSVSTALYSATATITGTSAGAYLVLVSASTTSTVTFTVTNGSGSYLSGVAIRWIAIGY